MSAGFKISGVTVFDKGESETWSSAMLNQRVLQKYGDDLIKDIEIDHVDQTTEITNEFFSAILMCT